jgi:putative tricarboxylic transport membrane protein
VDKQMLKNKDFIGGLFFLIIGLICLVQGYRLSPGTLSAPGAGFFPFTLSLILVVLSLILFFKSLKTRLARMDGIIRIGTRWKHLLFALAVLITYGYAIKPVGYILCSFMMLVLLFKFVEGRSWRSALILSTSCTLISYVVFAKYLGVPLPRGILPF